MSTRELELPQAASFGDATVNPSDDWKILGADVDDVDGALPCTILEPNTIIKVPPMIRQFGDWDPAHFHHKLRLPAGCSVGKGMTVLLEAKARECVAVALSPQENFVLGKTYVVHFGASGNISTVLRRRLPSGHEAVDITLPSLKVCSMESWIGYWITMTKSGKLWVGLGKVPGQHALGMLDDGLYHQLRSPVDAVRFVGLGNSVVWKQQSYPLKVRNVVVTTVPESLVATLSALPAELPPINMTEVCGADVVDEETQRMMEEYQKECLKQKKRAQKFGVQYKEPSPAAFLQWTTARKLRQNPQRGFITGMDIASQEEIEKQKARAQRFGTGAGGDNNKRDAAGDGGSEDGMMEAEEEALPVSQAWDNMKLVAPHRIDPPKALWLVVPDVSKEEEKVDDDDADFSMEPSAPPVLVPEKIHICSIDWGAMKQLRTDDIMSYFASYGPSYVEWLGEISCNVCFEDKFSAARALMGLGTELPSPPPTEEEKNAEADAAASTESDEQQQNQEQQQPRSRPDLGNMGWRLCRRPIRKTHNDRYGRRGTRARVLMRVAASTDVLTSKPTMKPKPPPGFSTKRVLGPGTRAEVEHRSKRRRRNNDVPNTFDGAADHPLLNQGLRAGRQGFTVEEMEAERGANLAVVGQENGTEATTGTDAAPMQPSMMAPDTTETTA